MFCIYVVIFIYVFYSIRILPKWKKDSKEFIVSVNYNQNRGYQSSIPKPIMDMLGSPHALKFEVSGKTIKITSVDTKNRSEENKTKK